MAAFEYQHNGSGAVRCVGSYSAAEICLPIAITQLYLSISLKEIVSSNLMDGSSHVLDLEEKPRHVLHRQRKYCQQRKRRRARHRRKLTMVRLSQEQLQKSAMGLCLCLSVTSRSSTKTAKRNITQTTPHDSPKTLVF